MLSNHDVKLIANQSILVGSLSDLDLIEFCSIANKKYRAGQPIISDEDYERAKKVWKHFRVTASIRTCSDEIEKVIRAKNEKMA